MEKTKIETHRNTSLFAMGLSPLTIRAIYSGYAANMNPLLKGVNHGLTPARQLFSIAKHHSRPLGALALVKDTQIGVRITTELRKELERIAERERRTLSQLVYIALEDYVARHRRRRQ